MSGMVDCGECVREHALNSVDHTEKLKLPDGQTHINLKKKIFLLPKVNRIGDTSAPDESFSAHPN